MFPTRLLGETTMNLYRSIVDYLLTVPVFDSWRRVRMILQRVASARPRGWRLPVIACQTAGKPMAASELGQEQ